MKRKALFAFFVVLAFSLMLIAGNCDVDKKRVKLRDLDKKLKKYENTKWDGLKKKKVNYVVSGNNDVDQFSLQSAVVYASLVQAGHVSNQVSKALKNLKKNKNKKAKNEAEENLKIAREVLEKSLMEASKIFDAGQNLVNNAESLLYDPTKYKAILEALNDSLKNLKKAMDEGPKLVKKLTKQSKQLAGL